MATGVSYWIGWEALSWGASWGDVLVAETWDTAQGVARNRVSLVKFSPIQDVEQRLTEAVGVSTTGGLAPSGEATAAFTGMAAATSVASLLAVGRASAFATFAVPAGAWGAVGALAPVADAMGVPRFLPATTRCGTIAAVGEAEPAFVVETATSACGELLPKGIRNPTDEELAAVVISLTRRSRSRITRTYDRPRAF